jgi:hypothetical protein
MRIARRVVVGAAAIAVAVASVTLAGGAATAAPDSLPNDALFGVACAGPASCTAVGAVRDGDILAEASSGSVWRVQATPDPTGLTGFVLAVSCASQASCVTAGTGFDRAGNERPVVEERAGGTWRIARSPQPFGAAESGLDDVSCWKPGHCMVVGEYSVGQGQSQPMAELWTGTRFQATKLPIPKRASGSLGGVVCKSATFCIAVGGITLASGANVPSVYRWNGRRWLTVKIARPAAAYSALNDVDCPTASTCYAVGLYLARTTGGPFGELWRSGQWHLMRMPALAATTGDQLWAIACPTTTRCVAIGGGQDARSNPVPFIETLRNGHWSVMEAPEPGKHDPTVLQDLSCAAPGDCIAVGNYQTARAGLTLAEAWNGTSWRILTTASP